MGSPVEALWAKASPLALRQAQGNRPTQVNIKSPHHHPKQSPVRFLPRGREVGA
jgi:hypothetical protein